MGDVFRVESYDEGVVLEECDGGGARGGGREGGALGDCCCCVQDCLLVSGWVDEDRGGPYRT